VTDNRRMHAGQTDMDLKAYWLHCGFYEWWRQKKAKLNYIK